MAPEQAMGTVLDGRADVYRLGVILYRMLVGLIPFTGDTPLATVLAHVQKPLPMPRAINPSLTPEVEAVLVKALAKDPTQRYPTAGALADALSFAVTGLSSDRAPARFGGRPTVVAPITPTSVPPRPGSYDATLSSIPRRAAPRLPGNRWALFGGVAGAVAIGALVLRMVAPSAGETPSTGAAALPTPPALSTPTTLAIVPSALDEDASALPEEPVFVETVIEPEPDVVVSEPSEEAPVPIAAPVPTAPPPPPPTPRPTATPRPAPTATTPPEPTPVPPPPVQAVPPAPAAASEGELIIPMGESGDSPGAPAQPVVVPAAPPTHEPAPGVPVLQMGAPAPTPAR
jgi:serine/threonine-protein kinase